MAHLVPESLANGRIHPWQLVFLYAVVFFAALIALNHPRGLGRVLSPELRVICTNTAGGVFVVFLSLVVRDFRQALPGIFGARKVPLGIGDFALAAGVMLTWALGAFPLVFTLPIVTLIPDGYALLGLRADTASLTSLQWLILACLAGLIAPVVEEVVFRGYLMNLMIARHGFWLGVVGSSIVFGLFHFKFALFATGCGLVLALMYARYGSLWPGILLHSFHNLFMYATGLLTYGMTKERAAIGEVSTWAWEIALAIVFAPLAALFWHRCKPRPE